MKTPAEQ